MLAQNLHADFIDIDRQIEQRSSLSISEIFQSYGEDFFRTAEAELIKSLGTQTGIVIATGGGAIVRHENRVNMRNGTVVYLQTSVAQQYERIRRSSHRPLLKADDPVAVLTDLLSSRDPLYRDEADFIVSTDTLSASEVAGRIEQMLMRI